jgi:hypothetical protein
MLSAICADSLAASTSARLTVICAPCNLTAEDQSMANWTQVRRRQSKPADWYLVTVPATRNTTRHVTVAWWEPGIGWQTPINIGNNGYKLPRPTHWQHLPKPARRSQSDAAENHG